MSEDNVISATHLLGRTDFAYAMEKIYPLIDKLDTQRKLQNSRFYKRLEEDLIKGCIMPPITIALIVESDKKFDGAGEAQDYLTANISQAFVLDGIQRLNTLSKAMKSPNIDKSRPLYVNVIICKSMDNLLYRMITLNNGQKPMTIRHQIEILSANVYNFDALEIKIKTEKDSKSGLSYAFKKEDIIKAYTAFLSGSYNIDNQK